MCTEDAATEPAGRHCRRNVKLFSGNGTLLFRSRGVASASGTKGHECVVGHNLWSRMHQSGAYATRPSVFDEQNTTKIA